MSQFINLLVNNANKEQAENAFSALLPDFEQRVFTDISAIPEDEKIVVVISVTGPRIKEEWNYHYSPAVLSKLLRRGDFMVVATHWMNDEISDLIDATAFDNAPVAWLPLYDAYDNQVNMKLRTVQRLQYELAAFLKVRVSKGPISPPKPKPKQSPSKPAEDMPSLRRVDRYEEGVRAGKLEQLASTIKMLQEQQKAINEQVQQLLEEQSALAN